MQTTKIYFPHPLPITQTPQTLYGWYLRSHETYIIATIAEGQNIGTAWIRCGEHLGSNKNQPKTGVHIEFDTQLNPVNIYCKSSPQNYEYIRYTLFDQSASTYYATKTLSLNYKPLHLDTLEVNEQQDPLRQKLKAHATGFRKSNDQSKSDFDNVLQYINTAPGIHYNAHHRRTKRKYQDLVYTSTERFFSVMWRIAQRPVELLASMLGLLMEVIMIIIETEIGFNNEKKFSLIASSATASQIYLRSQQASLWPRTLRKIRSQPLRWGEQETKQFLSLYNTFWQVGVDFFLGAAFSLLVLRYQDQILRVVYKGLQLYTVDFFKQSVIWLMGWPAGLKLNTNLDRFLGELFLWMIFVWEAGIQQSEPYIKIMIKVAGYAGFAGFTLLTGIICDAFALSTLHITCFYSAAAKLYHWQLNVLYSLFNLFRGKKYNVLRTRVDSCDYNLDQLLLGTLLFVLLTFLFPTVFVYYFLFAWARLLSIFIQVIFDTSLAVVNQFPFYTLILHLIYPDRLPNGIRFELCSKFEVHQASEVLSKINSPGMPPPGKSVRFGASFRDSSNEEGDGEDSTGDSAQESNLRRRRREGIRLQRKRSGQFGLPLKIKTDLAASSNEAPVEGNITVLELKSVSVPSSTIVKHFMQIWWSNLALNWSTVSRILVGAQVRPVSEALGQKFIPRRRYNAMSPQAENCETSPTFQTDISSL